MAQPYVCDLCNGELAVLMVTNVANGDTQTVGPLCMPAWAETMRDTFTQANEAAEAAAAEPPPADATEAGPSGPAFRVLTDQEDTATPAEGSDHPQSPPPADDASAD